MRKRMVLSVVCGLLSVVFFMSGCGYTTRSAIANKYRTIYIPPFANKVDITQEADALSKYKLYRPALETDITRYTINRFFLDGNLKPVNKENAEVTLKGEVVEFRKDPLRYNNDNDEVTEYRISLVVNLVLWNNKENKPIWEENRFTGETSYFVSGSQAKSESAAIIDSLTDLARRIVERAVEQW